MGAVGATWFQLHGRDKRDGEREAVLEDMNSIQKHRKNGRPERQTGLGETTSRGDLEDMMGARAAANMWFGRRIHCFVTTTPSLKSTIFYLCNIVMFLRSPPS